MNAKEQSVVRFLAENSPFKTYNDRQFFDENILARQYSDAFGIKPDAKWFEAFKIVTEGQGDEIHKINSLISSSLLSLLTFHGLFLNENKDNYLILSLPGFEKAVCFDKCLFEVRNRVVRLPSCVDVMLYSSEEKVMLLLESKFTEYTNVSDEEYYGKGYIDLYTRYIQPYLGGYLRAEKATKKGKEKLKLQSITGSKYIEGIKQSISHLIGVLRGPQLTGSGYYPSTYHDEYSKLYGEAKIVCYGTILFNPLKVGSNCAMYNDYVELYTNIIGLNGDRIVEQIRHWDNNSNTSYDKGKQIVVLNKPLTYQDLFDCEPNRDMVSKQIKEFYSL